MQEIRHFYFICSDEEQPAEVNVLIDLFQGVTQDELSLKYGKWSGNSWVGFSRWCWLEWCSEGKDIRNLKAEIVLEETREPQHCVESAKTHLVRVQLTENGDASDRFVAELVGAFEALGYRYKSS